MTLLQTTEQPDEICTLWRKRGPIGKPHNIVYHITRSTKRAEALARLQKEDTDKWSLTDGVADTVFAFVRCAVEFGIHDDWASHQNQTFHWYILPGVRSQSYHGWHALSRWLGRSCQIKEILKPLFLITKDLKECAGEEKHEGLLYQVVLELYGIYTHLRDCYMQYEHAPNDDHIKVCLKSAVRTLKKWL